MLTAWVKTVVAGVLAYLLLPTNITTASFMSDEEKEFALLRLQGKTQSTTSDRFKYVSESKPPV